MKKITNGIVCILGRPNVGKSTLFNALTRTRDALVDSTPGLTRDRIYGTVEYADSEDERRFWLIDTGGFETEGVYYQPFTDNLVWDQTKQAVEEADLVLFLLDAKSGLHPHDAHLSKFLRSQNKPVLFVVNKVDDPGQLSLINEFYALGADEIFSISAAHQRNVGELREKISAILLDMNLRSQRSNIDENATGIALIGRPNAGKSSILNRLLGENRSLVSDVAGTTRDAIDTPITYNGHNYVLIDTAGIRKRAKIKDKIESLSVLKSINAVDQSDIVVLVVDASEGFGEQEARLASLAIDQYKALLIVVNKWDLVPNKTTNLARDYAEIIRNKIKTMAYIPIIFVSCLENQRIFRLFAEIEKLRNNYTKRVGTSQLNNALTQIVAEHTPSLIKKHNKRVKFYYATQVQSSPPTIVIKCNVAEEIRDSYKRYMSHRFRELLGFEHTPLKLLFRGKEKHERDGADA